MRHSELQQLDEAKCSTIEPSAAIFWISGSALGLMTSRFNRAICNRYGFICPWPKRMRLWLSASHRDAFDFDQGIGADKSTHNHAGRGRPRRPP